MSLADIQTLDLNRADLAFLRGIQDQPGGLKAIPMTAMKDATLVRMRELRLVECGQEILCANWATGLSPVGGPNLTCWLRLTDDGKLALQERS